MARWRLFEWVAGVTTVNQHRHELRIGLTGGIASGKSTVADLFAELGIPIVDTDVVARQVVEPGQPGLQTVIETFGTDLLSANGDLDRHKLRTRVFNNPAERRVLEEILHPLIRTRTLELARHADGPYLLLVVPLLVETDFHTLVDRILVVDCPADQQRLRLLARDGETPDGVERILAAQASRHERLAAADDVIDNGGTLEETRARVAELHSTYLRLAEKGISPAADAP